MSFINKNLSDPQEIVDSSCIFFESVYAPAISYIVAEGVCYIRININNNFGNNCVPSNKKIEKSVYALLALPLNIIFNLALLFRKFPTIWK